GHSVGEYVAACVAGVFSLEDGLKLIAERGKLMQSLPQEGTMVALRASEAEISPFIAPYGQEVSLAAINTPESVVISGESTTIKQICDTLEAKGIKTKALKVSHGFHSPLMEPILAKFRQIAQQVRFSAPQIPLISNITGKLATQEITTADYWCRHIRQPVRFADGIESLSQQNVAVFLEIGPQPILLGMGRQCLPEGGLWLPSLRSSQTDWQQILTSVAQLYQQGIDINWFGFDQDYYRRREHLPTYPFQRQRHWLEPKKVPDYIANSAVIHPLLGQKLSLARTKEIRFQTQINQHWNNLRYLADHRIFKDSILPLTAYLEMALVAGKKVLPNNLITVQEVFIEQPLVLSAGIEEFDTLQLVLTPEQQNIYRFEIFSLVPSGETALNETWIRHACGQILLNNQESEKIPQFDLTTWQKQCKEQISAATFYSDRRSHHIDFGVSFQGVTRLSKGEGQVLGQIKVPETIWSDINNYTLHPAVFDASLHILGAILPPGTYLPVILDQLQVYRPPSRNLWSYATLKQAKTQEKETLKAEISLFDEQGNIIAWVSGLSLRQAKFSQIHRQSSLENHLYQVVWEPKTALRKSEIVDSKGSSPLHWLIFADYQGIGQDLAHNLSKQGHHCTLVIPGVDYQKFDPKPDFVAASYQINPTVREHFQKLLQDNPITPQQVVHLWSLEGMNEPSSDEVKRLQNLGSRTVLNLVQALSEAKLSPRLWLVTQGSRPLDSTPLKPRQAPVWGLGQAISLEYPELQCLRLDLDPSEKKTAASVQVLLNELLLTEDFEAQIGYRQGMRYVARLKPFTPQTKNTNREEATPVRLKIDNYGLLENLELAPLTRRSPQADEVEIKVRAAGLNFRDVLNALGMLQQYYEQQLGMINPSDLPFGFECAGEIVNVGENVNNFQIGDRVMALATGSLASFVTVAATQVAPKPQNFSFEEAATIPAAFLTAYYGLQELAQIKRGDRILIHSAAGGVGQAAVQLAQPLGEFL
ncbi:MAG TPA: beta-ketoacyl synthase, partial [Cyanothece sp. UBA12306]|nr:beta-ketoacyl synthase [Cyanothece sp. UBA12306]